MRYSVVKDGKIFAVVETIKEATNLIKLLGYGWEVRPIPDTLFKQRRNAC